MKSAMRSRKSKLRAGLGLDGGSKRNEFVEQIEPEGRAQRDGGRCQQPSDNFEEPRSRLLNWRYELGVGSIPAHRQSQPFHATDAVFEMLLGVDIRGFGFRIIFCGLNQLRTGHRIA